MTADGLVSCTYCIEGISMAPRSLSVAIGALLVLLSSFTNPATADDKSWDGKRIVVKKAGLKLSYTEPDGKRVESATLTESFYTVVKEKDGWLFLRHQGQEGWLLKSEAVLVEDAPAYFSERIQANPKDAWAWNNRGIAYKENHDLGNAIKDLTQAIQLDPKNVSAINNRGWVYIENKEYDKAVQDLTEAIRLDPKLAVAFNNRGNAYSHKEDHDKAIADYTEAIRLDPKFPLPWFNRGREWRIKKEFDKAIADYTEAIRLDPRYTAAFNDRGVAYFTGKKEFDKAVADYTEALRLDPHYLFAINNRGDAWQAKKKFDLALQDYDQGIRLDPKNAAPYNEVAWLRSTCPDAKFRDGKKAVELATKACELTQWKNPELLDTLAAAYAETGDFEKAIKYAKQALDDAEFAKQNGEDSRKRLKLYEQKKPFREE